MANFPVLLVELPFSEATGGHRCLASDPGSVDSDRLGLLLGAARNENELVTPSSLSVSRHAIQASTGRDTRETIVLFNIDTRQLPAPTLQGLQQQLHGFLDQLHALDVPASTQNQETMGSIEKSEKLGAWLDQLPLGKMPLLKNMRPSTPAAGGQAPKKSFPHVLVAFLLGAAAILVIYLQTQPTGPTPDPEKKAEVKTTQKDKDLGPPVAKMDPIPPPPKVDPQEAVLNKIAVLQKALQGNKAMDFLEVLDNRTALARALPAEIDRLKKQGAKAQEAVRAFNDLQSKVAAGLGDQLAAEVLNKMADGSKRRELSNLRDTFRDRFQNAFPSPAWEPAFYQKLVEMCVEKYYHAGRQAVAKRLFDKGQSELSLEDLKEVFQPIWDANDSDQAEAAGWEGKFQTQAKLHELIHSIQQNVQLELSLSLVFDKEKLDLENTRKYADFFADIVLVSRNAQGEPWRKEFLHTYPIGMKDRKQPLTFPCPLFKLRPFGHGDFQLRVESKWHQNNPLEIQPTNKGEPWGPGTAQGQGSRTLKLPFVGVVEGTYRFRIDLPPETKELVEKLKKDLQ